MSSPVSSAARACSHTPSTMAYSVQRAAGSRLRIRQIYILTTPVARYTMRHVPYNMNPTRAIAIHHDTGRHTARVARHRRRRWPFLTTCDLWSHTAARRCCVARWVSRWNLVPARASDRRAPPSPSPRARLRGTAAHPSQTCRGRVRSRKRLVTVTTHSLLQKQALADSVREDAAAVLRNVCFRNKRSQASPVMRQAW